MNNTYLTPKKQRFVSFIKDFTLKHQIPPTFIEIMDGLGISSLGTINWYVNELEKELSKEQDSKPKSEESPKAKSTESSKPKTIKGIIYRDKKYEPFNRYVDIKNLRLLVLDGVSDEIVIKISKTYENMFQDNGSIDQSKRDTLLNTLKNNYVFQRVGRANPDAYGGEPPCCPDYAHHIDTENINDFAHNASDYIWEKNPEESERQTIEVIEHLLHTITDQGFRHAFPETWEWNNSNSLLNMAMNQAIEKKIYNIESYKFIKNIDPVGYRKTIATEYAFWMILSAWNMFETAKISANEEWNLDSAKELKDKLDLSWKLYEETVLPVLSVPDQNLIASLYSDDIYTIDTFIVTSLNNRHEEYSVFSEDYNGNSSDGSKSTFALQLHSGANLMSFNVLPEDVSIENVFSSLGDNVSAILGEGYSAVYIDELGSFIGSLTEISLYEGYWLLVDEEDILIVIGDPVETDISYDLHNGFNLISYPYRYFLEP